MGGNQYVFHVAQYSVWQRISDSGLITTILEISEIQGTLSRNIEHQGSPTVCQHSSTPTLLPTYGLDRMDVIVYFFRVEAEQFWRDPTDV